MNRILLITVLALAAVAYAPPLAAQPAAEAPEPPEPPEPTAETLAETPVFGEAIDVRVVNIEVVVTDRDGVRITGLGPDDLVLYVDGEETPIDYFTEVRGGVALEPADGDAPLPGMPAAPEGEPVGVSYLVFVDDWFPIARDRDRVLKEMIGDLPNLRPGDRMAVVGFDGKRVEMISSWTGSPTELERAFRKAMDRPAFGLQRMAQERGFEFGRTGSSPPGRRFGLDPEERLYASHVERRAARAVEAAVATLRGFAQPPGRKVMLLLSGGWPYSPAAFAVDDPGRPVEFDYGYGARIYEPLIDTANLLGYTLYPVDVPGFAGTSGVDASRADPGGPTPLGSQSFERESLVHHTLRLLADETGGRPMINKFRTAALAEVAADTSSYYWIGFDADRRYDHELHRIRVEAADPELRIRTREGFRDLSHAVESEMAVESALIFGEGPAAEELKVALGPPERDGRRYIVQPLQVAIPVDFVTFLPDREGLVGHLELRFAALDEAERRSEVPTVPIEMRLAEPPPDEGVFVYETAVRLRNDEQDLVVSLVNPISGQNLMTRLEIETVKR